MLKQFDVHSAGDGDRLLVYLTLFVNQCLKRLESAKSKVEAQKVCVHCMTCMLLA